jgi:hypothetical protein
MFDEIKAAILRDIQTASESRYADGPRDALVHNYLLVEVCDRLEALKQTLQREIREQEFQDWQKLVDSIIIPEKYRQEDHHSADESHTYFKAALAGIATKEIVHYKAGQDFSGHLTDGIAQLYLEAQRSAYNKAMTTVGIKTAQEGIIGRVASGIKTTFNQALSWAKEQVSSIVSTLQDALSNFLDGLSPDLDSTEIAAQTEQFLQDYAAWKAPQVVNVVWGTGADLGTNAAIMDILDAATDPAALPGVVIDNIRVRVLPLESSNDKCATYAGRDFDLEEYDSIPNFPIHPSCPHYKEVYLVGDMGDEM